jgi:hypothetical protein
MHKWNKLYDYPKSVRELINSKRHYSIDGSKLPSVTTILDQTKSEETKASLAKWRQKVGEVEAERIKNSSTSRGTKMHSIIEGYLLEKNVSRSNRRGRRGAQNGSDHHRQGFT